MARLPGQIQNKNKTNGRQKVLNNICSATSSAAVTDILNKPHERNSSLEGPEEKEGEACHTCLYFSPKDGKVGWCTYIKEVVEPEHTCNYYTPAPNAKERERAAEVLGADFEKSLKLFKNWVHDC